MLGIILLVIEHNDNVESQWHTQVVTKNMAQRARAQEKKKEKKKSSLNSQASFKVTGLKYSRASRHAWNVTDTDFPDRAALRA